MTLRPPVAERVAVPGAAGGIETLVETPAHAAKGLALIAHPHPLFGGTAENKVVQTLAKTLRDLGYVALRPNFRGVGGSAGAHDEGVGETDDMLAVLDWAQQLFGDSSANLPVVLAGFSFGAYVQTRVATRLRDAGRPARRLLLIGTASGFIDGARHYDIGAVPADTIVIHGDLDVTVPLANVLAWARPLELPVTVVPGADHFFHRKLHVIRDIVQAAWKH
jgi:alpha/beta superfamily hydrolase